MGSEGLGGRTFRVQPSSIPTELTRLDESSILVIAVKAGFKRANVEVPVMKYSCINRIPYARGLGSSSAMVVGGVIAGLVLSGHKVRVWGAEERLQMVAEIEGTEGVRWYGGW